MTRSLLQRVPRYLPRPALRGLSSEAKPTNVLLNRATQPLPAGSTHRPSEFYARARTDRDLPDTRSRTPVVFGLTALGLGVWVAFYSYATNSERLSNSVTLQVIDTARADPVLRELLGDAIRPAPTWWLNGDPWISGTISTLQGHIDLSFRIKGHKQAGTVYFTSIRKSKGEPFTILRFRVIADDGTIVNVNTGA